MERNDFSKKGTIFAIQISNRTLLFHRWFSILFKKKREKSFANHKTLSLFEIKIYRISIKTNYIYIHIYRKRESQYIHRLNPSKTTIKLSTSSQLVDIMSFWLFTVKKLVNEGMINVAYIRWNWLKRNKRNDTFGRESVSKLDTTSRYRTTLATLDPNCRGLKSNSI